MNAFSVCREWEATALKVNKDVKLALTRTGVVLGKDGGALGNKASPASHIVTPLSFCG
ncbi:unnamed protein product [Prunus armeniaca]